LLRGDADWQRLKEGALIEIARRSPGSNRAADSAPIGFSVRDWQVVSLGRMPLQNQYAMNVATSGRRKNRKTQQFRDLL
jgi:hypothetical protein